MRIGKLALAIVAFVALAGCGGEEPPVSLGNEVLIEAPAERGQAQVVHLRGTERGSGMVGVVLAHMLNSSETAWSPLVTNLVGRGMHVLTFNFRGHGLSTGERNPALADLDLAAAVGRLRSLGATKIFVIGASMGGTAAVVVAASEELEGVIAISAPLEIAGLRADEAAGRLNEPSLFIAGEKEEASYVDGARALALAAPDPKRLELIRGASAHGTDLLIEQTASARVSKAILDFLSEYGG